MIRTPLKILPIDIVNRWHASLNGQIHATEHGKFYLVDISPTKPKSFQEQRIIVDVFDENGFGMLDIPIAFSYSTANALQLTEDFVWSPPVSRAFVTPTQPGGRADQIQGSSVRQGEPGGITVVVLHPLYSSDVVTGLGALHDHTGLRLQFQLQRPGVKSFEERLRALEAALIKAG